MAEQTTAWQPIATAPRDGTPVLVYSPAYAGDPIGLPATMRVCIDPLGTWGPIGAALMVVALLMHTGVIAP